SPGLTRQDVVGSELSVPARARIRFRGVPTRTLAWGRRSTMSGRNDNLAWMAIGGFGALIFGGVPVPLRPVTSASNLAFAFLAFTIVIAEVGGRSAALLTAVVSAMSLNFFLTEPYLTLTITKPDDVVAFLALAVCGLIAAAFGRRR